MELFLYLIFLDLDKMDIYRDKIYRDKYLVFHLMSLYLPTNHDHKPSYTLNLN